MLLILLLSWGDGTFVGNVLIVEQVIQCCQIRKASALDTKRWRTGPWLMEPKTPKDNLVDIMIKIPGILEDVDRLTQLPPLSPVRADLCETVKARCHELEYELLAWYSGKEAPLERLKVIHLIAPARPEPEKLGTDDLVVVYIMVLYWTICLLLYTVLELAGLPAAMPSRSKPLLYIRLLAADLPYLFHPSTGRFGIDAVIFPLGVALQYLTSGPGCMVIGRQGTGRPPPLGDAGHASRRPSIPPGHQEIWEELTGLLKTSRGREFLSFLMSMQRDATRVSPSAKNV